MSRAVQGRLLFPFNQDIDVTTLMRPLSVRFVEDFIKTSYKGSSNHEKRLQNESQI